MKYYVYVITEINSSMKRGSWHYKIGVAHNVERRRQALQTGNPRELEITHVWGMFSRKQADEIERKLHTMLVDSGARGEWFKGKSYGYLKKLVKEIFYGD